MEIYEDTNVCQPVPEPAPVCAPEPAPLPAFEPPAPVAPAPEMTFPAEPPAPVAAAPAAPAPVFEAPAPSPVAVPEAQPVAEAPLSSGTLLGPSTVGGSTDTGSWVGGAPDLSAGGTIGGSPDLSANGFVGGSPDLGGSTTIGGPTDLGMTWVDANGNPVDAPHIPVVPGPFNAAAAGIVDANNAAIVGGWLGGGADPYPSFWTPGFDSDKDGVLNEHDADPRDRFKR